jgi:hypothetical protein
MRRILRLRYKRALPEARAGFEASLQEITRPAMRRARLHIPSRRGPQVGLMKPEEKSPTGFHGRGRMWFGSPRSC